MLGRRASSRVKAQSNGILGSVIIGRELVECLAQAHRDLRVLYISGYTDDAIVCHGVLEEGTAFLQKPFTPGDVLRRVREVLDEAR